MKICFIICGQPRCIDLVLKNIEELFYEHQINYYICLTNNYKDYEKEYNYNFNINDIITNNKIIKLLLINDSYNSEYRNSKNYINKLVNMLDIIENKYNLYIIIRSDFIFNLVNTPEGEKLDFLNLITLENKIYLCSNRYSQYTKDIYDKCNDNIIICKNYNILKELVNLNKYIDKNNNYLEIVLYKYFKENNIEYEEIDIKYKLILSRCNIIAIAGDSGSGKTTLLNEISELFDKDSFLKLETDRYHKWERGNENYLQYTHLNPKANNLEKMSKDVYNLKIGSEIYSIDYDHNTGKFTQEEKIESKNNVILCGLHTLYNKNVNEIIDLKIFMDTDRELIKKWKIKRDVEDRGYNIQKVLKQIEIREKDYEEYIKNQKDNADIIINFVEEKNNLKCNLIIKNKILIEKIFYSNNIFEEYIFTTDKIIIFEIRDNHYFKIKKILLKLL
jgi:uridine kinase